MLLNHFVNKNPFSTASNHSASIDVILDATVFLRRRGYAVTNPVLSVNGLHVIVVYRHIRYLCFPASSIMRYQFLLEGSFADANIMESHISKNRYDGSSSERSKGI